ncbi:NAD(P)-dependent oxidoreductase [Thalassococcus profundi]|uniref:NAD(P)-dependent oxidoreductase n=1 Tax=Thalassococcus profundi TaxID=2282382 RepID=UPI004058CC42
MAAYDPFLARDNPDWQGVTRCTLPDLLTTADVLSLHVPLTEGTRGLIDREAIDRMKPKAILINTARGGIIDEKALAAALRDGRLGGAALDVFEDEPLPAESGAIFDGVPNLVLTPHIAGVTQEANVRVSAVTIENVRQELAHART